MEARKQTNKNCYIVHYLQILTEINPKRYFQAKDVRSEMQQGIKNKESGYYVTRPIPNICNTEVKNLKGDPVCSYPSTEAPSQTTKGLVHMYGHPSPHI